MSRHTDPRHARARRRSAMMPAALLAALVLSGCARPPSRPAPVDAVSEQPQLPDPAFLALDEILPKPALPAPAPAADEGDGPSDPANRAPLEALELYARARDAMLNNRRFVAIGLLEKAVAQDPDSFELQYDLGRAYLMGRSYDDDAIAAMTKAAAMRPDHLDLQIDLGRQYLAKGDLPKAIEHLRLALQTTAYRADHDRAAVADLFLGRALQQAGYDRAALEQYARLLQRVAGGGGVRSSPQLAFLITDRLQVDIGDLYAKHGQYAQALQAYMPVAEREPADLELQGRVVRVLAGLGRHDEAAARAAEAVVRSRAHPDALAMLREVYRTAGREDQAVDGLMRLHEQRPRDSAVLFALADLLRDEGRGAEAERLLARAWDRSPDNIELLRRRFALRAAADVPGAARLLVEALARRPELAVQTAGLWDELLAPSRPDRLRLADLRALQVGPGEEAAKWYWVARVAGQWRRRPVAREALERSAQTRPPFAPAFRALLEQVWERGDWDALRKQERSAELADEAAAAGDEALAEELRGLALLRQERGISAERHLARAIEMAGPASGRAGGASPDLRHAHANAVRRTGNNQRYESLMWDLISDWPGYDDAYMDLYRHYSEDGRDGPASRVVSVWLAANPRGTAPRLLEVGSLFRSGQADSAERLLLRLFDEHGGDSSVLSAMHGFYERTGRLDEFVRRLEQRHAQEPGNFSVGLALTEMYAKQGRLPEASRLVDALRAAAAGDPDLLYQVSHLYTLAGQSETGRDVLRQVLRLDPDHAPAANDLGYALAEEGEELAEAEALTRRAVELEPYNGSFLDSLGWVLYKRGRFEEAREHLERAVAVAVATATPPDPVVLDHLGDVLYQLGDRDGAAGQWRLASERLGQVRADREDLRRLRLRLERKTRQFDAGRPVTVSPVTEQARQEGPRQAARDGAGVEGAAADEAAE